MAALPREPGQSFTWSQALKLARRGRSWTSRCSTSRRRIRVQLWRSREPCTNRIHANVLRVVLILLLVANAMVCEAFLPDQSSLCVRGHVLANPIGESTLN